MKQFITMSKLELLNLFGLNVYMHEKDPADKKRRTIRIVIILITLLLFAGYFCGSAYGLILIRQGEWIPFA